LDKHHFLLIALLYVLIFIAGCQQAEYKIVEPNKAETPEVEIYEPEPNKAELPAIVSPKAELPKPEPNEAQNNIEAEQIVIEPNDIKSRSGSASLLGYGTLRRDEHRDEPITAQPEKVEPNEVETASIVSFHDKCADILNSFVDRNGLVDYTLLRRKRLELRKLLNEFDDLDPYEYNSWPKPDKIAFWINAYNIQMLNIIIENYPIQASRFLSLIYGPYSIRHIKGIWTDYKFMVMDEEFTLREIQQRFFHKQFDEPRVFLALTNASPSSPILRNEPYYGHKLEEQLADQTKRFLSSPQGFKIDRKNQIVYLSAIFQPSWYGKEFISKFATDKKFKDQDPATRAVLNFITNYISDWDVSFLEVGNYTVKYIKYDWTINDGSINP